MTSSPPVWLHSPMDLWIGASWSHLAFWTDRSFQLHGHQHWDMLRKPLKQICRRSHPAQRRNVGSAEGNNGCGVQIYYFRRPRLEELRLAVSIFFGLRWSWWIWVHAKDGKAMRWIWHMNRSRCNKESLFTAIVQTQSNEFLPCAAGQHPKTKQHSFNNSADSPSQACDKLVAHLRCCWLQYLPILSYSDYRIYLFRRQPVPKIIMLPFLNWKDIDRNLAWKFMVNPLNQL